MVLKTYYVRKIELTGYVQFARLRLPLSSLPLSEIAAPKYAPQ
jgi:hypothetical protein